MQLHYFEKLSRWFWRTRGVDFMEFGRRHAYMTLHAEYSIGERRIEAYTLSMMEFSGRA